MKIFLLFLILIILIMLETTNVFGEGAKINVGIDNIIYPAKDNANIYYQGEFSNANWFGLVLENAKKFDISPALILGVIKEESGGFIWAISTKNALGLMQIEPQTAVWIAQKKMSIDQILIPSNNIAIGSKYLQWLIGNFRGNISLALAGYNAGQNHALQDLNNNKKIQEYVNNVLKYQSTFEEEGLY